MWSFSFLYSVATICPHSWWHTPGSTFNTSNKKCDSLDQEFSTILNLTWGVSIIIYSTSLQQHNSLFIESTWCLPKFIMIEIFYIKLTVYVKSSPCSMFWAEHKGGWFGIHSILWFPLSLPNYPPKSPRFNTKSTFLCNHHFFNNWYQHQIV